MKCIKELTEHIYEEIDDCKCYALQAIEIQNNDRTLGETYINLAKEEMNHANRLHDQIARIIAEYRSQKGEPPTAMIQIYNWEHERIMKLAAEAQCIINNYK